MDNDRDRTCTPRFAQFLAGAKSRLPASIRNMSSKKFCALTPSLLSDLNDCRTYGSQEKFSIVSNPRDSTYKVDWKESPVVSLSRKFGWSWLTGLSFVQHCKTGQNGSTTANDSKPLRPSGSSHLNLLRLQLQKLFPETCILK